jgi:putative transposase
MVKPVEERRAMIEHEGSALSVAGQCRALGIHRSGLYYTARQESAENLRIMRMLDEQYMRTPYYGVRRLQAWLSHKGYQVNGKRLQRLMGVMGWQTLYRAPRTSIAEKGHVKYPYLLKGLAIERCNQVWATDITYIPMQRGFLYLCAVIDVLSRYVVAWSLSNTMDAEWCRDTVAEAMTVHGTPDIVNSDQGSQFTSEVFTSLLHDSNVRISMDGKGRAIDNIFIERLWRTVKYEHVYLHIPDDGAELYAGLQRYFRFYNTERLHQSLGYQTPGSVYLQASPIHQSIPS